MSYLAGMFLFRAKAGYMTLRKEPAMFSCLRVAVSYVIKKTM